MANFKNLIAGDLRDPRVELRALFPAESDSAVQSRALAWAFLALDENGIDHGDELRVIATLRKAEPGLSLKPATYLAALVRNSTGTTRKSEN